MFHWCICTLDSITLNSVTDHSQTFSIWAPVLFKSHPHSHGFLFVLFCHLTQSRLALPAFRLEFRTLGDAPSFSPSQVNSILRSCISSVQKSMLEATNDVWCMFPFLLSEKSACFWHTVGKELVLFDIRTNYIKIGAGEEIQNTLFWFWDSSEVMLVILFFNVPFFKKNKQNKDQRHLPKTDTGSFVNCVTFFTPSMTSGLALYNTSPFRTVRELVVGHGRMQVH